MAVTTSHEFVVRVRARSDAVIRSAPASPMQHELVVRRDRWAGDVGDVGHDRVHRHVADERHAPAADEGLRAVRERARPAVAVAERQRRDPARAGPSRTSGRS